MDIITWVQSQINTNPVFGGVIGASMIAGASMWLRQLITKGRTWFSRYCTSTFSVTNEDTRLYKFVNEWVISQKIHRSPRRLVIQSSENRRSVSPLLDSSSEHTFAKLSDTDSYLGWYKGFPVWVAFQKKERDNAPILRTLCLTFYFRGPKWLNRLTDAFTKDASDDFAEKNVITVLTPSQYGDWTRKYVDKRGLETIYLPSGVRTTLLKDIHSFLLHREGYARIGKPWRRNYLLGGPPGCGKTSLVLALAAYLDKPCYIFTNLSRLKDFVETYSMIRPGSMVVFEDIDQIGAKVTTRQDVPDGEGAAVDLANLGGSESRRTLHYNKASNDHDDTGVTMSDLFNVLDGGLSVPGVLVFMTTNYPESLDSALLRKGRTDRRFDLGKTPSAEIPEFVSSLGVEWTPELERKILQQLDASGNILPADLQEIIYQHLYNK